MCMNTAPVWAVRVPDLYSFGKFHIASSIIGYSPCTLHLITNVSSLCLKFRRLTAVSKFPQPWPLRVPFHPLPLSLTFFIFSYKWKQATLTLCVSPVPAIMPSSLIHFAAHDKMPFSLQSYWRHLSLMPPATIPPLVLLSKYIFHALLEPATSKEKGICVVASNQWHSSRQLRDDLLPSSMQTCKK